MAAIRRRMARKEKGGGEKELLDMAEAQHGAQLVCHFCGGKYEFSEAELREIAARAAEAKARREDLDEPAD